MVLTTSESVRHLDARRVRGVADIKTVTVSHYTTVTAPLILVTGLPVRLNETKRRNFHFRHALEFVPNYLDNLLQV